MRASTSSSCPLSVVRDSASSRCPHLSGECSPSTKGRWTSTFFLLIGTSTGIQSRTVPRFLGPRSEFRPKPFHILDTLCIDLNDDPVQHEERSPRPPRSSSASFFTILVYLRSSF